MTKVCLPELGDEVKEATVSFWHLEKGAEVKEGQDLVEMTTDKATFNVPAPTSGTLSEIKVREGDVVNVGDVLAIIE